MNKLKPDMYKKNIYDIDYEKLKKMGKKYIFFDIDNTLISYLENKPTKENKELFLKLKKMGFICFLFSNSPAARVKPFIDDLKIDAYVSSMKPLKKNYKKVLSKYNKDECVFIGDQIMTDVIGAKRNGLFVIFLDRINDDEPMYTRFWRFFEGFILKKYNKKDILVKGKYYD